MTKRDWENHRIKVRGLLSLVDQHELLKSISLSLIGTENQMSVEARRLLASDLSQRYYLTDNTIWEYPQGDLLGCVERTCTESLCRLFDARYANVRPLSGISAMTCLLAALTQPGQRVVTLSPSDGGHGATAHIARRLGLEVLPLPFDRTALEIDFDQLQTLLAVKEVHLIYLDFSNILFVPDLTALLAICCEPTQVYLDCSQLFGLMLADDFPTALARGLPVMGGSSHKSFPGPQKGFFLTNSDALAVRLETATNSFVSNHHVAAVAALGVTSIEMEAYGAAYSQQLRRNAAALGEALFANDVSVHFTSRGFTETHQLWIDTSLNEIDASEGARRLKEANIVVNCARLPIVANGAKGLRLGLSELTRIGMLETEMQVVGRLFADALYRRNPTSKVATKVKELRSCFSKVSYCFDD